MPANDRGRSNRVAAVTSSWRRVSEHMEPTIPSPRLSPRPFPRAGGTVRAACWLVPAIALFIFSGCIHNDTVELTGVIQRIDSAGTMIYQRAASDTATDTLRHADEWIKTSQL